MKMIRNLIFCFMFMFTFLQSNTTVAKEYAPFMVNSMFDDLVITSEKDGLILLDVSLDNGDKTCLEKARTMDGKNYSKKHNEQLSKPGTLPITLNFTDVFVCPLLTDRENLKTIIVKTSAGDWSFKAFQQDLGIKLDDKEKSSTNAVKYTKNYYAWLASSPQTGEGSVKVPLPGYSGEVYASKEECENVLDPPNMFQMLMLDVRELNLKGDYTALMLCEEVK